MNQQILGTFGFEYSEISSSLFDWLTIVYTIFEDMLEPSLEYKTTLDSRFCIDRRRQKVHSPVIKSYSKLSETARVIKNDKFVPIFEAIQVTDEVAPRYFNDEDSDQNGEGIMKNNQKRVEPEDWFKGIKDFVSKCSLLKDVHVIALSRTLYGRLPCAITVIDIFRNLITPKNCFGITILAKICGDDSLRELADKFVVDNFDIIRNGEPLKLLSHFDFITYWNSCDLEAGKKRNLAEARRSGQTNNYPIDFSRESFADHDKAAVTHALNESNPKLDLQQDNDKLEIRPNDGIAGSAVEITPQSEIETGNSVTLQHCLTSVSTVHVSFEGGYEIHKSNAVENNINMKSKNNSNHLASERVDYPFLTVLCRLLLLQQIKRNQDLSQTDVTIVDKPKDVPVPTKRLEQKSMNDGVGGKRQFAPDIFRKPLLHHQKPLHIDDSDTEATGEQESLYCRVEDLQQTSFNIMEYTIAAKSANDIALQKFCTTYIRENKGEVLKSAIFKSCTTKYFLRFLHSCYLSELEKLQLALSKLNTPKKREIEKDLIKYGIDEEDHKLAETAIRLSLKCPRFISLTTHVLKQAISVHNCLNIAILSRRYNFEELQIWAEFHLVDNSSTIVEGISNKAYGKHLVLTYLEAPLTPLPMQCLMMSAYLRVYGHDERSNRILGELRSRLYENEIRDTCVITKDNVTSSPSSRPEDHINPSNLSELQIHKLKLRMDQFDVSDWLLSQLCKLKTVKTQKIGPAGGTIRLNGCSLSFPEGAVMKDTDIEISLDTNPENFPRHGFTISPVLGFKPSVKFQKPIIVNMRTFFRSARDEDVLHAEILCKESGSDWKPVPDCPRIQLGRKYELCFPISHFCQIAGTVSKSQKGEFSAKNDIYIRKGTCDITSYFYLDEEDESKIWEAMVAKKNSPFCARTLVIDDYTEQDEITVHLSLTSPEETIPDEKWKPSNKLTIAKLKGRPEKKFSMQTKPKSTKELQGLSSVQGEYEIRIGGKMKDCAYVSSEWPVELPSVGARITNMIHTMVGGNATMQQTKYGGTEIMGNPTCQ